ncbi:hypothetical protein [Mycobacterium sp.]|uniref:hypothetical protein n=1 Tax=Mycobacterium sp. TaxID=1785 RepID=UPI002D401090|nr:hypothetical protein [Mycobacterium sp.]HZA11136.1 hypothetical protein [Mycobacterium sp.]
MTETPEHQTEPTSVATAPPRAERPVYDRPVDRPSRLTLIALWVAIVAGVVFIIAVIFFSGFALGRHSGGGGGGFHHRHGGGREFGGFHKAPGPMGQWGPYQGPFGGPGAPGGPGGVSPSPTSVVPSPPATPRP